MQDGRFASRRRVFDFNSLSPFFLPLLSLAVVLFLLSRLGSTIKGFVAESCSELTSDKR